MSKCGGGFFMVVVGVLRKKLLRGGRGRIMRVVESIEDTDMLDRLVWCGSFNWREHYMDKKISLGAMRKKSLPSDFTSELLNRDAALWIGRGVGLSEEGAALIAKV